MGRRCRQADVRRSPPTSAAASALPSRIVILGPVATAVRFNFVDKAHDIDSTVNWTCESVWDTGEANIMQHHNSLFHGLLKQIPWARFDGLVRIHKSDARVRRLNTRQHFIALLYGQLAGANSLREIELGLASHASKLYHLGAAQVSRSTLCDANAARPAALFTQLFSHLLGMAHRGLRKNLGEAVHLIDSTNLKLTGASQWARFCANTNQAKLHIVYDPDADCPIYASVTPANVNDITVAKDMPIEPNATYVFDLGYYDFAWWAKLDSAGCRIVSRLKINTPLLTVTENTVKAGGPILSDRTGTLRERMARNRKNPYSKPIREIVMQIATDKTLRIFTNDLKAPASDIAALYKRRWQIELFFKWVKQTLKIKHFLGNSENAVRIQIAVALITFLLLRMAQKTTNIASPLAFLRLVRINLMAKRQVNTLLKPPPIPAYCKNQLTLEFAKC